MGDDSKKQRKPLPAALTESFRRILNASEEDFQNASQPLKVQIHERLLDLFPHHPEKLARKIKEVDSAFGLLTRIKEALQPYLGSPSQNLPPSDNPQEPASENKKKFFRRWKRRPVTGHLQIQDFSTNSFAALPIRSLSAEGCLVDSPTVPDSFYFVLSVKGCVSISGVGQKIYSIPGQGIGVKFLQLPRETLESVDRFVRKAA